MQNNVEINGDGNIVLHSIDGSTVIINKSDSEEIRKLVINLGSSMSNIPQEVLRVIEQQSEAVIEAKANVYLTVLLEAYGDSLIGSKLKFGLTITNLAKEHRYYNSPFFVIHPKFTLKEGMEHDTFRMVPVEGNVFAKKLEYGEPFSVTFDIKTGAYEMYESSLSKDTEAYIQAFVSTTLGEVFESNKFKIGKLIEYREAISQS